jgi:antitoxin component YwqK of YwqJK toxin-antitoxin module
VIRFSYIHGKISQQSAQKRQESLKFLTSQPMNHSRTSVFTFLCCLVSLVASAQHFTKIYAEGDSITRHGNGYLSRNIRFQLDKTDLIPDSNASLDSIASFLKQNDSLIVEIGVHGSTRNSVPVCVQLTRGRALSISSYLTTKGVHPQHLISKGYGQTRLLYTDAQIQKVKNPEQKELLNRRNRRVEFILVRGQKANTDSGFMQKREAQNKLINGIKEGRWVEYYHHDVEYTGIEMDTSKASFYVLTFYKHGHPFGMQRKFDKGGMIMLETPYSDSGINGIERKYYEREFECGLYQETFYINGKKNGLEKQYFCNNGKLWKETIYKDNEPDGQETEYYETGELKYTRTYARGRTVGIEKEYYINGNMKAEILYDDNGWEKKRTAYDETGKEIKH